MISMGVAIALSCDVTCAFRALTSIVVGYTIILQHCDHCLGLIMVLHEYSLSTVREFEDPVLPDIGAPVTSEVVGSIPVQTHSSRRFHSGLRFPPTLHYKSPNIANRANNFLLVDAQLSIQYFYFNTRAVKSTYFEC
jgi:hypothetical protein